MKNKSKIISLLLLCVLIFTGCAKGIDITNEQSNLVAEYIAGSLVKYSYSYQNKYEDLQETKTYDNEEVPEIETETETEEGETETAIINPEDETTMPGEKPTEEEKWEVAESMGLKTLELEYVSFDITNEYPKDESSLFSFTAEKGYTFLVFNFKLYNPTEEKVIVNNSSNKPAVRMYINDYTPVLNYGNLMLNDITNLKNVEVEAKSTFDGIIVFMVNEEYTTKINSLTLQYDGKEIKINRS